MVAGYDPLYQSADLGHSVIDTIVLFLIGLISFASLLVIVAVWRGLKANVM